MRVFLSGGTGFIGQALVRRLRGRGWPVVALVRDPASAPAQWLAHQGCTLARGDVTERDAMRAPMRGVDLVLHAAGVYELGANAALRERMRRVNVDGTGNMLALAHELGIRRTLVVSTALATGTTGAQQRDEGFARERPCLTAYEESKAQAHQLALGWREQGLPLVIAMPNAVVGPNDHSAWGYMLRLYLMGLMPPLAWGADAVFSLVEVESLADGLLRAAEHARPGELYHFSGEPRTVREHLALWNRHPGGAKRRLWLPPWLMKAVLAPLEPLQRAVGLPAFLSRDAVSAGSHSLNFSHAKAQRELGWSPPTAAEMWPRLVEAESALMAQRSGFLNRLRHQAVVDAARVTLAAA